jgi:Holliday junction resolvasome RuvABC DNA-binding subunit
MYWHTGGGMCNFQSLNSPMNFSSKLLEDAVAEFAKLPGVGQKTALRLVLHLLNRDKEEVQKFSNAALASCVTRYSFAKPAIIYPT